jgi:thioredoxin-like negative regulator of GroEL
MSFGAGDGETYADAHQLTLKTGRPMLVMVSTEWCVPCQMMKRTIMPQVRQRGLLGRVAFANVDPDRDHELAHKLTGGGPVPQLVIYRKTATGWFRRSLVGSQSVEAVEQLINEAIAADQADSKETKAAEKPRPTSSKSGPTT